jgi:hypothetical protein
VWAAAWAQPEFLNGSFEMRASEIFEAVTGSGSIDFATLVAILNRRGAWCLIGGLAINCYVEPVCLHA